MQKSQPKIVHISTVHTWDDNRVFQKICRSLARNGYDVTYLAIVFHGQNVGDVDGVHIETLRPTTGRLSRVFGNLPKAAIRAWSMRAAIYHLHDPELIPLIPILRLRGAKVIYDAHEDLKMQILQKDYIPKAIRPWVARVGKALCAFADRTANHVIAAAPEVADSYRGATCTVIRNYAEVRPASADSARYEDRGNNVVYVGGINRPRGIEQMIDAMQHAELPPEWRLVLVGAPSPDDLIDDLRLRPGWTHVDYRGFVTPPAARQVIGEAKIGLAVLQPIGQYIDAIPGKLFEYMCEGVPFIVANYPRCREIVERCGCGLVVDPTDPKAIGEAIGKLAASPELAKEMGERGRAEVASRFNWSSEEQKLLSIYARLLGTGGADLPAGSQSERSEGSGAAASPTA